MGAVIKRALILTMGLTVFVAASAAAHPRRHSVAVVPRVIVHRPYFSAPYWGPWHPYGFPYTYPYTYTYIGGPQATIRTDITPKAAEVFVDGYYAGHASDFDGAFKQLSVAPGGHAITFYLDGFRTVTQEVYVRPDSTFRMDTIMEPLAAGQTSAPAPAPESAR